jgi:hypothetical protein
LIVLDASVVVELLTAATTFVSFRLELLNAMSGKSMRHS